MNPIAHAQHPADRPETLDANASPGQEFVRAALARAAAAAPSHDVPSISCIIPCRNEAGNLDPLLTRLTDVLCACTRHWEIIIIDDGSTDATLTTLLPWTKFPAIRVLQLSRNFSKDTALTPLPKTPTPQHT